MDTLRMSKAVRKVIKLRPSPSGGVEQTVLYEQQGKKKKQTRVLRPLERVARRLNRARRDYWTTIAEEHDRSNEKKRDGWARDGVKNVLKASRKSSKQIRKIF
jgi:hypothetical protein